jgi:FkbM family methyltransferase
METKEDGVNRSEVTGINLISYDDCVTFVSYSDFYQMQSLNCIYREIWKNGEYSVIPVEGEQVVDVGGFLGESAIYFLQNGAKFVNIYEPGQTHGLISLNMIVNGFTESQFYAHNKAVTGLPGVLNFKSNWNCGQISFEKNNAGEGINVMETASLKDIAVQDAILKFDTEGSEYDTFELADCSTISKFKGIMLEFHDRGYMPITKKLEECGFEIVKLKVNPGWNKETEEFKSSGMIYAKRSD